MTKVLERLRGAWARLPRKARARLAAGAGACALVLAALFWWARQPVWSLLFTGLDPADSRAVVSELQTQRVPFRLRNGGMNIDAPVERVDRLRMDLAAKNLPGGGRFGLVDGQAAGELFVEQGAAGKSGVTALAGELARTIESLDVVRSARVHLALPGARVGAGDDETAAATVMVNLRPGTVLPREQAQAIVRIVSGAAPGLSKRQVRIVDAAGRTLWDEVDAADAPVRAPEQELRLGVEKDVNAKVARVLEPLVGAEHFVVRTTAEVAFQRIVRREKLVDPDVAALVSERRTKERAFASSSKDASRQDETGEERSAPERETNTISNNYDYSVVERTIEEPSGQLKRLSVAVLVDEAAGQMSAAGSPPAWRSPEALKKIEQLVKTAISFDGARGDVVTIEVAPFQALAAPSSRGTNWRALAPYAKHALLLAVLALGLLLLGRSLLRSAREALAPVSEPPAAPPPAEAPLPTQDVPADDAAEARWTRLAQLALERPRSVGQTVRLWLHESASGSTDPGGAHKAAVFVTLIGEEAAAAVLRELEADEVAAITAQIARTKVVDPYQHTGVLEEFEELARSARRLERAGVSLVRRLLSRVHPGEDVERLVQQSEPAPISIPEPAPQTTPRPRLLEGLAAAPPRRLALLLNDEPDQTVALVLAHLPAASATQALALLAPARRVEVTRRMAAMEEVRPDVVERVGAILESRLASTDGVRAIHVDGVQAAADALAGLDRSVGQEIVEALAEGEPTLSQKLRERLFTFQMLRGLADREVQELTRLADRSVLALALRGADPELRDLFLRSMSEHSAALLREAMDLLGAPRIADIEKAQRQIVEFLLHLEREGAITLEEQEEVETVL